jgi:DNA replication factor GINS
MAPPDEMGFKFIQQVQQRESRSQNLTKLPADFFDNLAVHIAQLQQLARDEVERDPMSTSSNLVQNELRSTLRLCQEIISLRLRKMANRAVDSLEGGKVDLRSLTPKEKDIYGDLARIITTARGELAPRSGRVRTGPSKTRRTEASPPVATPEEGGTQTPSITEEEEALDETAGDPEEPKVLLHILEDMPSFVGAEGRSYSLKKGDMVTLPRKLGEVLIARGTGEEVSSDSSK